MSTMDAREFLHASVDEIVASLTLDEKVSRLLAPLTTSDLRKDQSLVWA